MATKQSMAYVDDLTWTTLNQELMTSDEDHIQKMINWERKHRRRLQFMLRMHARLNKVRASRERKELAEAAQVQTG